MWREALLAAGEAAARILRTAPHFRNCPHYGLNLLPLPSILRTAPHFPGRIFVDHYANTALVLILPAVEEGIFNSNWRIRQSSVLLMGKLLFKVCDGIANG